MNTISFGVAVSLGLLASVESLSTMDAQLDRVDQMSLSEDSFLRRTAIGLFRPIYVVDCGVAQVAELSGRVTQGYLATGLSPGAALGNNHGTRVATVAAGTTRGIAPGASIIDVKVCAEENTINDTFVLAALDWLLTQPPGVVNLSLEMPRTSGHSSFAAFQTKVDALTGANFNVVASAGNYGRDVRDPGPGGQALPGAIASAFTVANVAYGQGVPDTRYVTSNYGAAVDLFAPGQLRANDAGGALTAVSGTSGSAALVSGALATARDLRPTYTAAQLEDFVRLGSRKTAVAQGNSPNSSGANDAFLFSRETLTPNSPALAQMLVPGEVIINDGAFVGTQPVLAGATNRDPFSGALLSEYEACIVYLSSSYQPGSYYFRAPRCPKTRSRQSRWWAQSW